MPHLLTQTSDLLAVVTGVCSCISIDKTVFVIFGYTVIVL